MRDLTDEEVLYELQHLDGSNGWGVKKYRDGVEVSHQQLERGVVELVKKFGSYPVGKTWDSSFHFLILKEPYSSYTLGERYEASMLNYKTNFQSGGSLAEYAKRLVSGMFYHHINGVSVY